MTICYQDFTLNMKLGSWNFYQNFTCSLTIPVDQILSRLKTSLQLNQVKNKKNKVVCSVS